MRWEIQTSLVDFRDLSYVPSHLIGVFLFTIVRLTSSFGLEVYGHLTITQRVLKKRRYVIKGRT